MDVHMNEVLAEVSERLSEDWDYHENKIESYLSGIKDMVSEQYELDEDVVHEAVRDAACRMIEMDVLPPLPEEEEGEEAQIEWVESAHALGLLGAVFSELRERAE